MKINRYLLILLLDAVLFSPIAFSLLVDRPLYAFLLFLCVFLLSIGITIIKISWLKTVLINIALIVAVLFNAEVCFRAFFKDRIIPNLYEIHDRYYFNKPYLDETLEDQEYISIYRTNVDGYRIANNVSHSFRYPQCDILFVGDSFTQGAQVDYDELFSSITGRGLGDSITVVNAGISGAGVVDEFYFLYDKAKELYPRYVVLEVGVFNDFFDIKERKAGFVQRLVAHSGLFRYLYFNRDNSQDIPLGRWTEPFFPDQRRNVSMNIMYKETCDNKELDKRNLRTTLLTMNNYLSSMGAKLIVLLIPSKEQVSTHCLDEVLKGYNIREEDIDLSIPNSLLKGICNEGNIDMIDLTKAFKESTSFPYFQYDEHMNSIGHRITSDALIDYFISNSLF